MQLPQEGSLLRIFIGEADKQEGKPLYEWIVLKAREHGLEIRHVIETHLHADFVSGHHELAARTGVISHRLGSAGVGSHLLPCGWRLPV